MKKSVSFLLFLLSYLSFHAQWSGTTTPTYPELIAYYQQLDRMHPEIELYAMGASDLDWPIYVCIINGAQDSVKTFAKARAQTTILVNNAIHAGEPDGVNASLIWIDDWIRSKKPTKDLPVIAFIPAYNVGGMFNRSSSSRANQDGPEEYGFRGNASNLDLNRDFMKMDSRNAFTFAKIYQALDPDVFVDNHVSNGADYQYTLTMISSMKERMAPPLREMTYEQCVPALKKHLFATYKTDLCPYVELKEETPEQGIVGFNDLPRYAMGYASLFHSLSFTVETHMLKPFPQRVEVTRQLLEELIRYTGKNAAAIEKARAQSIDWWNRQQEIATNYGLSEKADSLLFKGYAAVYKPSGVTGLQRLSYDRTKPYVKNVPYFATHVATDSVEIPKAFVVHAAAGEVIRRLSANGVTFRVLPHDTTMVVTTQHIAEYETAKRPYEGHYLHTKSTVRTVTDTLIVPRGSLYIPTAQPKRAFLMAALNPKAEDSYFAWNFFDSYLQQKEYFSAYVFEDLAKKLLDSNPALAKAFAAKKSTDPAFAASSGDQLFFIYKNSPYFEEATLNRLPVYLLF